MEVDEATANVQELLTLRAFFFGSTLRIRFFRVVSLLLHPSFSWWNVAERIHLITNEVCVFNFAFFFAEGEEMAEQLAMWGVPYALWSVFSTVVLFIVLGYWAFKLIELVFACIVHSFFPIPNLKKYGRWAGQTIVNLFIEFFLHMKS